MSWFQKTITLEGRSRGFHLVTREILDQLPELKKTVQIQLEEPYKNFCVYT